MSASNVLASLAVKNVETSLVWYESVLGRPADARPTPELAEWEFEGGGWLQVYQLAERAGTGSCTLVKRDMDARMHRIATAGITVAHISSSEHARVIMIKDPDGNSVAISEEHA